MQGNEIIVPPEDIQLLVEKTAEFVVKNGSAIEAKIWETQKSNPKFSFLKHGDLYRPFYERRIFEFAEKLEQQEFEEEENEVDVEEPQVKEPELSPFCLKHPIIAKIDMDIIKTTALFTAKNGKKFWEGLGHRENHNPQFSFIKPNHALFSYYTALVEAYTRCMLPQIEDLKTLQRNLTDRESVLQRCLERFSYEKGLEKNQRSKEEMEDEERQQMALIDWHDFVVVETIDFGNEEILPPPADPSVVQTMSVHLSKENYSKDVKIDTGVVSDISNLTQKCPICRNMIPIDDFQEHIKLELIDPKYKQEKELEKIKEKEKVFASGSEIYKNLQNLSKQRPDLAGPEVETRLLMNPSGRVENSTAMFMRSRVQASAVMDKPTHRSTEEILPNLVPERQWSQMHSGPIPLHIQIPNEGGDPSWGFRGQILQISVEVKNTIGDVKTQLAEILGNMPIGKMKLKNHIHSVMKDSNTLAYYNIIPASIVELCVKERGGRRKNY